MSFHAVAALVLFCAVVLATVVLVLVPVTIQLPAAWHQHLPFSSVSISYAGVPVAGTLLMLMTGVLDGQSFAAGIVGDEHLKPYGIVILFMALAYMSSSLDMTGCFQWVALHLTRKSRGNGLALFLLYYTLSSILTIFTSNDVSIMALTPIIYYFALATDADPIPFLTAMFTAANIWSMLLFVGNPTNIIVAMAYRLSFLQYSKWMALPTIAAGFAALGGVLAAHWHSIPKHLQLPDLHPSVMLVDRPGAMLGTANILICLGLLAVAPTLKWELWVVTLVCAVLHALYNFIAYVGMQGRWCKQHTAAKEQQQQHGAPAAAVALGAAELASTQPTDHHQQQQVEMTGGNGTPCQEQQWTAVRSEPSTTCQETGLHRRRSRQSHDDGHIGPLGHQEGCRGEPCPCPGDVEMQIAVPGAAAASAAAAREGQPTKPPMSSSQPYATEDGVDEGGQDPEQILRSRTSSRAQLLTASQHALCSDSAAASKLQFPPSSSSDMYSSSALHQQEKCSKEAGATAGQVAEAATATSEGSVRIGLQPPSTPTFWKPFVVLPWEIVPFVLGMFCVVEGLNANGWVDSLARALAGGLGGSVWGALFGVGWLSVLLANIINNQPMTILMTRVCMSPAFTGPIMAAATAAGAAAGHAAAIPVASAFAVVVASNTAANFSVMGALAGIMFVNILQQRGMNAFSYWQFTKLMVPSGLLSTVFALVVLGAEFATWRL